ncbi:FAD-dependent monooxygenase [Pigmentiphaga kullae]|uniref:FAD-dependent monooxygenase n=1 Tax=Pigmentiphaga kullae TaxID=151784 RepID=UPI0013EE807B|nr:FAD-dependent monooxygenase [Pigmentiphaga kullae]
MSRSKNVGIVGAGIGGLTAAIALRQFGHDVTVFEQAKKPSEIGAGIIVGPNAVKVLRALDLGSELDRIAVEPGKHRLRNWKTGRIMFDQPMGESFRERFGAGYLQVHRADLIEILVRKLPADRVCLSSRAASVRQDSSAAALVLENGKELEFDMLVGADGIKSAVRSSLFGLESPRFTGNVCWRGTVPSEDVPQGVFSSDIHVWVGPGGHVVNYYIRGGKLMNFIAIHQADDWSAESWSFDADREELARRYADWHPALAAMFERATACSKWALFDRDPMSRWSEGRVTLLGDAAHPMLPYLAQGAAMAMEDGIVLAKLITREVDIVPALQRYEKIRLPRTTRTQLGARARAKQNHMTSPVARLMRDIGLGLRRTFRPSSTSYNVEWLYEYDAALAVD